MLRKWQLSLGLWPPGGSELVVGDPLADRTQVERDPMTRYFVFPEKDALALESNEYVMRAGFRYDMANLVSRSGLRSACEHPGRAEAGVVFLDNFLDSWASLESREWSRSPQHELLYVFSVGAVPEGTEYFSCEPPINWDRWHDLRDIVEKRALTVSEQAEYQRFARIVARLDAEAARPADGALDGLVKEHEGVIASIQRLTAAVRAAAEQR